MINSDVQNKANSEATETAENSLQESVSLSPSSQDSTCIDPALDSSSPEITLDSSESDFALGSSGVELTQGGNNRDLAQDSTGEAAAVNFVLVDTPASTENATDFSATPDSFYTSSASAGASSSAITPVTAGTVTPEATSSSYSATSVESSGAAISTLRMEASGETIAQVNQGAGENVTGSVGSSNTESAYTMAHESAIHQGDDSATGFASAAHTENAAPHATASVGSKTPSKGYFTSHPVLALPELTPASMSSKIFAFFAHAPIIPLTLCYLLHVVFTLHARELWFPYEIQYADAFLSYAAGADWFTLHANGALYADKPPLYFLFLLGLQKITPASWIEGNGIFFLGSAVSGLLFLWATLMFGRIVGRFNGKALLASGIILLCSLMMIGIEHDANMNLLFASLVLISLTCLYVGMVQQRSFFFCFVGFVFSALACLTHAGLGLLIPLVALLFFSFWRNARGHASLLVVDVLVLIAANIGWVVVAVPALQQALPAVAPYYLGGNLLIVLLWTIIRCSPVIFFRLDFIAGILAFLLVIGAWCIGAITELGSIHDFLTHYISVPALAQAANVLHPQTPWFYYFIVIPLLFLPWTFMLVCLPYQRIFTKSKWQSIALTRTEQAEGLAFLWCVVVGTILLLSIMSNKHYSLFLAALPALALLTGRGVLTLPPTCAALFRHGFALLYLAAGVGVAVGGLVFFGIIPLPVMSYLPDWQLAFNPAIFIVSIILLTIACSIWFVLRSNRSEGTLLLVLTFSTCLHYPVASYVTPMFDTVYSPKRQALLLKTYMDQGYSAYVPTQYHQAYTFYTLPTLQPFTDVTTIPAADPQGMAVLVDESTLGVWLNKPACLEQVDVQWLESQKLLLFVCPPEQKEAVEALAPDMNAIPAASATAIDSSENSEAPAHTEGVALPVSNGTASNVEPTEAPVVPTDSATTTPTDSVVVPTEHVPAVQTNSTLAPQRLNE